MEVCELAEMVRVNTRVSAAINDWLDDESFNSGVPKSTLIHIALENYIQTKRSVDALHLSSGALKDLFDKVDAIEKRLSSGSVVE